MLIKVYNSQSEGQVGLQTLPASKEVISVHT